MLKTVLKDYFQENFSEESWFEALKLSSEGKYLYVRFPHAFFGNWFFKHKKKLFEEAVRLALPSLSGVHYAESREENSSVSRLRKKRQTHSRTENQINTEQRTLENFFFNEKKLKSANFNFCIFLNNSA